MKVIIAGGRDIENYNLIVEAINDSEFDISEVVSGGAKGVDTMGEHWADKHNIPVKRFLARWEIYGRSAGPHRNIEMANYAEALIAVWDGKSRGTKNMIETAKKRKLDIYIKLI